MAIQQSEDGNQLVVDPTLLRGLAQAKFVSESLCKGDTEEIVIGKFRGDGQLVKMWINFLRHNGWIRYDAVAESWSMTDKALTQAADYD